eukprot:3277171-Pyramimonas_sp.AAC.1
MAIITVVKHTTVDIGSPVENGYTWSGAIVRKVGDTEFVTISKGDPCLTKWFTQKKSHNTQLSALAALLMDIQKQATSDALGHEATPQGTKSVYRQKQEKAALKALSESSDQATVDVVLPSFDSDGETIAAVHTKMPLDPCPVHAMVVPDPA